MPIFYSVRQLFSLVAVTLSIAFVAPTHLMHAALPNGSFTAQEQEQIKQEMQMVQAYLNANIAATNTLFSTKGNFDQDLKRLQELKEDIAAMNSRISVNGSSPLARYAFTSLKALKKYLLDAQTEWVKAMAKKELSSIDAISSFMRDKYDRAEAQIIGGDKQTGLKGAFRRAGLSELYNQIHEIHTALDYLFFFHARSPLFKGSIRNRMWEMGDQLKYNKGFSGTITASMIGKFMWAQNPPQPPKK